MALVKVTELLAKFPDYMGSLIFTGHHRNFPPGFLDRQEPFKCKAYMQGKICYTKKEVFFSIIINCKILERPMYLKKN